MQSSGRSEGESKTGKRGRKGGGWSLGGEVCCQASSLVRREVEPAHNIVRNTTHHAPC
jgi:hypothetical protein